MYVLDASVALKWFLREKESETALEVARAVLRGEGPFFVPELFYYEVLAVTARKTPDAGRLLGPRMRWLMSLPLRRMPMTAELAEQIAPFVGRGLTGYDGAYAALAQLTQSHWLTYDTRARAQLGNPDWIGPDLVR